MFKLKHDRIGTFIGEIEKTSNNFFADIKFLASLNASANFLKHHHYQFEEPYSRFHLLSPALVIIIDKYKRESKYDYAAIEKYFEEEITYHATGLSCSINCDVIVDGFNSFYKKIIEV